MINRWRWWWAILFVISFDGLLDQIGWRLWRVDRISNP
jgi:hypothetical protein